MQANNQANFPPKSCTIEKLVTIPKDVDKVIQGQKKATRRNARYADIGEKLTLKGEEFVVHNVYSQTLGEMSDQDAIAEGYENLEEYQNAILSIHPGMKWAPKMNVWVHEYKRVTTDV